MWTISTLPFSFAFKSPNFLRFQGNTLLLHLMLKDRALLSIVFAATVCNLTFSWLLCSTNSIKSPHFKIFSVHSSQVEKVSTLFYAILHRQLFEDTLTGRDTAAFDMTRLQGKSIVLKMSLPDA